MSTEPEQQLFEEVQRITARAAQRLSSLSLNHPDMRQVILDLEVHMGALLVRQSGKFTLGPYARARGFLVGIRHRVRHIELTADLGPVVESLIYCVSALQCSEQRRFGHALRLVPQDYIAIAKTVLRRAGIEFTVLLTFCPLGA